MRRIETPTLLNAAMLVYGIEPGGTIEAVIDSGRFVYELGATPIATVNQLFGRVTLERKPIGEITLLVNRPEAAPTRFIDIPIALTAPQGDAIKLTFENRAAPTELRKIAGYLDRIERHLDRLVNMRAA